MNEGAPRRRLVCFCYIRDMCLSEAQRRRFFDRGYVRLPGSFSVDNATRMVNAIWEQLESRHGARRDDPSTWTLKQPTGFQSLTRSGAFNSIASPGIASALDSLLGAGAWTQTKEWGAPLVTFPESGRAWDVPRAQWHLDFPARGNVRDLPGVRVLAFIAPVDVAGGGTVLAEGTHRLVERLMESNLAGGGHSAMVRDRLAASHPWLAGLWAEGGPETDRIKAYTVDGGMIEGIEVRVTELTGEAGDVVLMHPWTFHAPAPNCGRTPRMMISHSVYRKAASAE